MSKVLVYDIETSPIISYNWGIWEQNAIEVIEDWQILTVAYKWLGDKKVSVIGQDDFIEYVPGENNDRILVEFLRDLFDEADVVIAHNGDAFDQKKSQARMLAHQLTPPSPYQQIDTYKIAKKYACFSFNKLDYLGEKLGVGRKSKSGGFDTWKGCLAGDKKAWNLMKKYNKHDVELLERVYLKLRPWITSHPAMNVMDGRPQACPKCGEGPLQRRGTAKINKTTYAERYQCQACGGWSQERKNTKSEVQFTN